MTIADFIGQRLPTAVCEGKVVKHTNDEGQWEFKKFKGFAPKEGENKVCKASIAVLNGQEIGPVARLKLKIPAMFGGQIPPAVVHCINSRRVMDVLKEAKVPGIVNIFATVCITGLRGKMDIVSFQTLYQMDLYELLKKGEPLSEAAKNEITRQLLTTVAAMHEMGAYHCDLKPANILVDKTESGWKTALCDFDRSWAKAVSSEEDLKPAGGGTPAYLSPEVALGHPVTPSILEKNDIWSLGRVLAEIHGLQVTPDCTKPNQSGGFSNPMTRIARTLETIGSFAGREGSAVEANPLSSIQALISRMMSYRPESRPSAEEALRMFLS